MDLRKELIKQRTEYLKNLVSPNIEIVDPGKFTKLCLERATADVDWFIQYLFVSDKKLRDKIANKILLKLHPECKNTDSWDVMLRVCPVWVQQSLEIADAIVPDLSIADSKDVIIQEFQPEDFKQAVEEATKEIFKKLEPYKLITDGGNILISMNQEHWESLKSGEK